MHRRFLPMKHTTLALFAALTIISAHAEDLPKTLMTLRGRVLASEDFAKPPALLTGKPVGFASGFTGWRYTSGEAVGRSGRWEIRDCIFTGIESPRCV